MRLPLCVVISLLVALQPIPLIIQILFFFKVTGNCAVIYQKLVTYSQRDSENSKEPNFVTLNKKR